MFFLLLSAAHLRFVWQIRLLHLTGALSATVHLHSSVALGVACVVMCHPVISAHWVIVLRTGAGPLPRPRGGGGGGGAGVVWTCYRYFNSECDIIKRDLGRGCRECQCSIPPTSRPCRSAPHLGMFLRSKEWCHNHKTVPPSPDHNYSVFVLMSW